MVATARVGTAHRDGWNDVVWTVRRAPIESIGPEGLLALRQRLPAVSAFLDPAIAAETQIAAAVKPESLRGAPRLHRFVAPSTVVARRLSAEFVDLDAAL